MSSNAISYIFSSDFYKVCILYTTRLMAVKAIKEHALLNEAEQLQWVDRVNSGVVVSILAPCGCC